MTARQKFKIGDNVVRPRWNNFELVSIAQEGTVFGFVKGNTATVRIGTPGQKGCFYENAKDWERRSHWNVELFYQRQARKAAVSKSVAVSFYETKVAAMSSALGGIWGGAKNFIRGIFEGRSS